MAISHRFLRVRLVLLVALFCASIAADSYASFDLRPILEVKIAESLGQCRAAPVDLGSKRGIFIAYCEDAEIDPYVEMFFFPCHRIKMMVLSLDGMEIWKKELGPGVIPGIWFAPFFPFDLDGNGIDEIWFVNNTDDQHPLSLNGRRLEQLDARTGETLGRWPWPAVDRNQSPSHTFRNFILGGQVKETPRDRRRCPRRSRQPHVSRGGHQRRRRRRDPLG
jgi:hypothetical protein